MKLFGSLNKYFVPVWELSVDPICRMKVQQSDELKFSYQGSGYYFCSANCLEEFKQNPQKFISTQ